MKSSLHCGSATGGVWRSGTSAAALVAATAALCGAAGQQSGIPRGGLLLWLSAEDEQRLTLDGDAVVEWRGRAGTRAGLAASGTQAPTWQRRDSGPIRPAVRFDGQDDVLRGLSFNRRAGTWTLVLVAAPLAPCRGGGLCSSRSRDGDDFDPGFTVDLYRARNTFDQISVEGAGRIGGQKDQMLSAHRLGGFHVIVVQREPETVRLFVDGGPEGTRAVHPAETVMDELRLGARWYAGVEREYFHGEIATVLLYDRVLTDGERRAVESALRVSEAERQAGEEAAVKGEEERLRNRMKAPVAVRTWPSIEAYCRGRPAGSEPGGLPIRSDVREAVALGMQHLRSLFDRDRDDEPFFYANCEADGTGKMHHSVNIGIPHVVGRCLLGAAIGQRATGVTFPDEAFDILERYCRLSFDNPDHLNSYIDPERGNQRFVELHNVREGLYGLWALIQARDSQWARDKARAMLRTLDQLTDGSGGWSVEKAKELGMADRCFGLGSSNSARVVDPLLAYYDVSDDPLALDLAGRYARDGLRTLFTPEGALAPMDRSSGHVHSITSSLSGITAYAVRVGDREMLATCRRIVDVGVPEYFSSWGWGDEVYPDHPADVVSRGEINQTGDVVRAALLLGSAGHPRYYELAERYLRSMLLTTQHREPELRLFLRDKAAPKDDSERDVLGRTVGGYSMQLPNDRMREGDWPLSTLDITSGAVHAMSECMMQRTVWDGDTCRVNLLFSHEDERIVLRSRLPCKGEIAFEARRDIAALKVRVPTWVDRTALSVSIEGRPVDASVDQGYVRTPALEAGASGALTFPIRIRTERETVDGVEYRTTWLGDQIIAIEPRGAVSPLPF